MTSTAPSLLQITVNGERYPLAAACSVADFITELKLDPRKVAIERNLAIVPRSDYGRTLLSPGDAIEIVGFIGGG
jgi:thiamine biosynthesis protein ThiS